MQLIRHPFSTHRYGGIAGNSGACCVLSRANIACNIAVPTLIALVVTTRIFSSGESNQQLIQARCDG